MPVNSSTSAIDFALHVSAPSVPATVTGNIVIPPKMDNKHDTGSLLAIRDGLIIDRIDISSDMATGGSFTFDNLPGGTSTDIYKLYAIGWNSAAPLRTGMTSILKTVDLRTGSASGVDLTMFPYRVKMNFVDRSELGEGAVCTRKAPVKIPGLFCIWPMRFMDPPGKPLQAIRQTIRM